MNAADAHALLLTCPAPVRALKEFGEAVAGGEIEGTATVIYNRNNQVHEGQNAKLQRYWRRIEVAAQQASVWTVAAADLPVTGQVEAVRLEQITFDDDAVAAFVATRQMEKPRRGRKRIQDEWTPFWIAAAKLAKVGMLNKGTFPTQADLRERLHTMMGATLDEQTIKPLAAILYREVAEVTLDVLEQEHSLKD